MTLKHGDTVTFNETLSTVVTTPFQIGDNKEIVTIVNKYDGEIDVNINEVVLEN